MKLIFKESMTKREVIFKRNVLQYMREDGFPKFADYLQEFHFNFLTSAQYGQPFVAAIDLERGIVYINPNVDSDAISLLLRHEAGHHIFKHHEHFFAKLKKLGIDTPSEFAHRLSNIAGDYDISNHLYDKDDYIVAKSMSTEEDGEVGGLVTELDFPENPEYWTMDFDQLWDEFVKKYKKDDLAKKILGQEKQEFSDDFIKGWNKAIDAFNAGEISIDDIIAQVNKL